MRSNNRKMCSNNHKMCSNKLTIKGTPDGDLMFTHFLDAVWCDTLAGWLAPGGALCAPGRSGGVFLRMGQGDTLGGVVAGWCDARYRAGASGAVLPRDRRRAIEPRHVTRQGGSADPKKKRPWII